MSTIQAAFIQREQSGALTKGSLDTLVQRVVCDPGHWLEPTLHHLGAILAEMPTPAVRELRSQLASVIRTAELPEQARQALETALVLVSGFDDAKQLRGLGMPTRLRSIGDEAGTLRQRVISELRAAPQRPSELCKSLGVDRHQISRTLAILLDEGRIDALRDVPSDRRAVVYSLSASAAIEERTVAQLSEPSLEALGRVEQLRSTGRLQAALDLVYRYLAHVMGRSHPSWTQIHLVSELGVVQRGLGRFAEASRIQQNATAMAALRQTLSAYANDDEAEEQRNASLVYTNLGMAKSSVGDYADAIDALSYAVEIKRDHYGRDHVETFRSIGRRAQVRRVLGHYADACDALKGALEAELAEPTDSRRPYEIAKAYSQLGYALTLNDRPSEGLEQVHAALNIVDSDPSAGGTPARGTIYTKLAVLMCLSGDFDQALLHANTAVHCREQSLPDEHPDISNAYTVLGYIYTEAGRLEDAESILMRALVHKLGYYDWSHPDIVVSCSALGHLYHLKGNFGTSSYWHSQAKAAVDSRFGVLHPLSAHASQLADSAFGSGDPMNPIIAY